MVSLNGALRALTLFLLLVRFLYWHNTQQKAYEEKPKTHSLTLRGKLLYFLLNALSILLLLQLIGLDIFVFPYNEFIQVVGFLLTLIGAWVAILGRRELGTNWTHGAEYQIKKDQNLVTTGIYRYIRHPIYAGLLLVSVGAELVAQSYLSILIGIIGMWVGYIQCKKEEALLLKHFGRKYEDYMKRTKMLIPYIL